MIRQRSMSMFRQVWVVFCCCVGPWWLILAHAARPSSRRARWLVRCRS